MATSKKPPKDIAPRDLGPTGLAVADAVRFYRQQRGYSYAQLEERLDEIGNKIPILGLRRIEAGARRVDVDDVMALAYALGTNPLRLLTHVPGPGEIPDEIATGVPEDVSWGELVAWTQGLTELSLPGRVQYLQRETERLKRSVANYAQEIEELKTKLAETPGDEVLSNQLHWAQGEEVATVEAHARASDALEVLRARLASEGDASSE